MKKQFLQNKKQRQIRFRRCFCTFYNFLHFSITRFIFTADPELRLRFVRSDSDPAAEGDPDYWDCRGYWDYWDRFLRPLLPDPLEV